MNWSIVGQADQLENVTPDAELGEGEGDAVEVNGKLVAQARDDAVRLAGLLGDPSECHVEIRGHETVADGDGFKPAHVTISVSRIDVEAVAEQEAREAAIAEARAEAEAAAEAEAQAAEEEPEEGS